MEDMSRPALGLGDDKTKRAAKKRAKKARKSVGKGNKKGKSKSGGALRKKDNCGYKAKNR